MAQNHVIKISNIVDYFKDEKKLISKGENSVESGHVGKMTFDPDLHILKGVVHASMRDRQYKVEIYFTSDWIFEKAVCSCPRGQLLCHHMAALALFGHYNVSVTDKACSWNMPTKAKKDVVQTISQLYPPKQHQSTSRNLTEEEIEKFKNKLQIFDGAVGYSWLLSKENSSKQSNLLQDVGELLFCNEYIASANKAEYFIKKLMISPEIIEEVAAQSIGQSENENWLIFRKHRLTASNFGVILGACRRNRFPPSLFKRLTGAYILDNVKAIQWGRAHEKEGVKALEQTLTIKVESTGLWLHPCGFLGASPDGLIGDNAIVEVKCPFKYKDVSLTDAIKGKKEDYIICADEDGNFILNKKHDYYLQIQGQLAITGRILCYLVIWTPKEVLIFNVEAESFEEEITALQQFYVNQYRKFVTGETD